MAAIQRDTRSPLRALLAAFVMALAVIVGVAVVLQLLGATFPDYMNEAFGGDRATLLSRVFGALAVLCGLAAILFAYVGWYEEPRFDGVAHSGFPRFIPVSLWLATLALLWWSVGALKPVAPATLTPKPAPVVEPAKPEEPLPLEGGAPPPPPEVRAIPLSATYTFKYPLITSQGAVGLDHTERDVALALPMDDPDGAVRALLCDKAWVALAGSASQEGDRARNEIRSRLRAEAAVARAEAWLAAHKACRAPVLIGLDLGQHEPVVGAPRFDGVDTAPQRQLIVVSRQARAGEAALSLDAALDEAEAFYNSPAGRAAILGGRRYEREPVWLAAPN